MQQVKLSSQLDRILSSSLPTQLLTQLTHTQQQLSLMQSALTHKNNQIKHLHQSLRQEINTINEMVKANDVLTSQNSYLKRQLSLMKSELKDFKKVCTNKFQQYFLRQKQIVSSNIKAAVQLHGEARNSPSQRNKDSEAKINKKRLLQISAVVSLSPYIPHKSADISQKVRMSLNRQFSFIIESHREIKQTSRYVQTNKSSNQSFLSPNQYKMQREFMKIVESLENQIHSLKLQKQEISIQLKRLKNQMSSHLANNNQNEQNSIELHSETDSYPSEFASITSNNVSLTQQEYISKTLQNPQNLIETKFIGKLIQNSKYGKGICEYEDGWSYEGEFKKNQRHGLGSLFYKSTTIYSGNWKEDRVQGSGILYYHQNPQILSISGNFANGAMNSYGKIKFKKGFTIRCRFANGKPEFNSKCMLTFERSSQSADQVNPYANQQLRQSSSVSMYGKLVSDKIFEVNYEKAITLY